jgi:hypothetical protein
MRAVPALARRDVLPQEAGDPGTAFYLAADNSWDDESQPERHIAWTETFWQAVAPHTDGAYARLLGDILPA